ncbi:ecdysteroid kinase [Micromonospora pisi]|uniref:Ecdysteroid kinase n=1 Tax=Micromonospora pisi TaxID=589240 RepID=A0A495JQ57_9ACTN|nr:oxidoreductase family protein [Micromonospora pisi]RKR91093.1 ecdysteroid kinase [Micromonospora pisi]
MNATLTVADIDHEWIRRRLGWPLGASEAITVCAVSQSGGLMGGVYRVSCAGRSFVFKEPPDGGTQWGRLALDTGLVAREVQLYRLLQSLRPPVPGITPACHWSTLSAGGLGALALEDLGPSAPVGPVMAAGLTSPQADAAMRSLARAHAILAAQGVDRPPPPYRWLYAASSPGLIAAVRMGLDDLPRVAAERWPENPMLRRLRRIVDIDVESVLADAHSAHCLALCHGDAWAGNILFRPGGGGSQSVEALLLDWQFAMWGNPLSDVALLLMSSLTPAARQASEDELLRRYHTALTTYWPVDYTLDACRDDLHRAEPAAALVALASLEAYTSGMGNQELPRLAARVQTWLDRVASDRR